MMKKVVFDSSHVETITQLHTELARMLDFPDYYGANLDALYDCLSGEIELPLTLIWKNYHMTKTKLGKDADKVLKVMKDFAREDPDFTIKVE
ncbi:MAG: barstar family protein [Syntrophaceae bacterium]